MTPTTLGPEPTPDPAHARARRERIVLLAAVVRGVLAGLVRAVLDHALGNG